MRYIGLIKSPSLVKLNPSNPNEDRILVGTYGFLTGTLTNLSGVYDLHVNFYVGQRESQDIVIKPHSQIFIENMPCERLQISLETPYQFALYSYCFKQSNADNDIEAASLLLNSRFDVRQVPYDHTGFIYEHYTLTGSLTNTILVQPPDTELFCESMKFRLKLPNGQPPVPPADTDDCVIVLTETHQGGLARQFAIFNLYPDTTGEYEVKNFFYEKSQNSPQKSIDVIVGGSPYFQQNGLIDVNTKYKILGQAI